MGGREYSRNLIRAVTTLPSEDRNRFVLTVIVDGQNELDFYKHLANANVTVIEGESAQPPYTLFNRIRWKTKRLTGRQFNPRLQEYLTSIEATFAYSLMTAHRSQQPFRSAVWIPDFQFKHFPQGAAEDFIQVRKREGEFITANAQTIVLSSAEAERDCLELYPNSKGRTQVLRFRVSIEESVWDFDPNEVVALYNLPKRFFLVSNLLAPTKNHGIVLEALKLAKSKNPELCVVFTGDVYDYRNPGFYNQFLSKIHLYGLNSNVRLLGLIPKQHQFQLLRASQALIQPSLFEGWHTGVEEAHYVGQRLLLTDIPVHKEQDPPNAHFFEPNNSEQLCDLMLSTIEQTITLCSQREDTARNSYFGKVRTYAYDFLRIAGLATAN